MQGITFFICIFEKTMSKMVDFKFSQLKIYSSYIFSENEISALEKDSGIKFPKHLKVKLKKIT